MKLGLVGGGFMGEAIIAAALRDGVLKPADVIVSDISAARRDHLASAYGLTTTDDNGRAVEQSELALFAVKPQEFGPLTRGLKVDPRQTVVSIMAGVTIKTIGKALGHEAVVRVMPNTPASVGEGMSLWTATDAVDESRRAQVRALLGAMGLEIYVDDEKYIDMATALSASGPGFVLLMMEAFADAGVHIGLKRETAVEMVTQTFLGTARLAKESGRPFADLRHAVTSPGGTTAEGLLVLESAGMRAAIIEAIVQAYEKAKALGG